MLWEEDVKRWILDGLKFLSCKIKNLGFTLSLAEGKIVFSNNVLIS